jgi:hypothetical protein
MKQNGVCRIPLQSPLGRVMQDYGSGIGDVKYYPSTLNNLNTERIFIKA